MEKIAKFNIDFNFYYYHNLWLLLVFQIGSFFCYISMYGISCALRSAIVLKTNRHSKRIRNRDGESETINCKRPLAK